MGPPNNPDKDPSSAPLADYFWIAGVDSLSYGQHFKLNPDTGEKEVNGVSSPLESTIDEDAALETSGLRSPRTPQDIIMADAPSEMVEDSLRFSKHSHEMRMSMHSTVAENILTPSNRSSATIRPVRGHLSGLSDDEFDKALRKFAIERESFLDELSFDTGGVSSTRSHIRPKSPRMGPEETNGTRPGSSSVRRHFSLRDLNSMKRQPSMARAGEPPPWIPIALDGVMVIFTG